MDDAGPAASTVTERAPPEAASAVVGDARSSQAEMAVGSSIMEVQTYEALFDHLTQLGPRRPHLWIEHIHTSKNALEAEARSCPHGRVVPAPGAVSSSSAMPSDASTLTAI